MENLTIAEYPANDYYSSASQLISKLEGATHTLLVNSGIPAIATILATLWPHSKVIVQEDYYSGTRHMIEKMFKDRICYLPVKAQDHLQQIESFLASQGDNISMILLETPSNPLLLVYDI